jgi:hypothetical protein
VRSAGSVRRSSTAAGCAVRRSSLTPVAVAYLATMSPTAPEETGSGTADGRERRLTNSASVAAVGRAAYQRLNASWASACNGMVLVRPRLEPRTTTSSRGLIAAPWSDRGAAALVGLAAAFLDVCEREAGEF